LQEPCQNSGGRERQTQCYGQPWHNELSAVLDIILELTTTRPGGLPVGKGKGRGRGVYKQIKEYLLPSKRRNTLGLNYHPIYYYVESPPTRYLI
jgi:hypothetical protein